MSTPAHFHSAYDNWASSDLEVPLHWQVFRWITSKSRILTDSKFKQRQTSREGAIWEEEEAVVYSVLLFYSVCGDISDINPINSFHVNVALSVLIDFGRKKTITFSLYPICFSLSWLFYLLTPSKGFAAWEPLKTNFLRGYLVPKAFLSKSTFAIQKLFPLLWLRLAMVYFGLTHINHLIVKGKYLPSILDSEDVCRCFTSQLLKLAV